MRIATIQNRMKQYKFERKNNEYFDRRTTNRGKL